MTGEPFNYVYRDTSKPGDRPAAPRPQQGEPLRKGQAPRAYGKGCWTCIDTGFVCDSWDKPTEKRCPRGCVTPEEGKPYD